MPTALLHAAGRPLLGDGDRELLRARAGEGVRRARRSGQCLVAITVALARRGERVTLTLAAIAAPDDDADALCAGLLERVASLRSAPLPLLDPDPTGRYRVVSAMPPEHYESAVARAVERIRAGALDKIVLAREVQVHAPRA